MATSINAASQLSPASHLDWHSQKPSLLSLPTETLQQIYASLELQPFDDDILTPVKISQEWLNSRLVCSQLNEIISPSVFRTVNINFRWTDNTLIIPRAYNLRRTSSSLMRHIQGVNIVAELPPLQDNTGDDPDIWFHFSEACQHDSPPSPCNDARFDEFDPRASDLFTDILQTTNQCLESVNKWSCDHRKHRAILNGIFQGTLDEEIPCMEKTGTEEFEGSSHDSETEAILCGKVQPGANFDHVVSEILSLPRQVRLRLRDRLQALSLLFHILPTPRLRTLTARITSRSKDGCAIYQPFRNRLTQRRQTAFMGHIVEQLLRLFGPHGLDQLALDVAPITDLYETFYPSMQSHGFWVNFGSLAHLTTLALPALDDKPDTSGALTSRYIGQSALETVPITCTTLRHLIIRDAIVDVETLDRMLKPFASAGKLQRLTLRAIMLSVSELEYDKKPFGKKWPRFGDIRTKDHYASLTALSRLLTYRRYFPRHFDFRVVDVQWSGGPNSIPSKAIEWLLRKTDLSLEQELLQSGHDVEFINEERALLTEDFWRFLKNLHPQGEVRS